MSQVAYQVGAYPGFCSMKRLGVFLLPSDGMLVHRRLTPSIKLTDAHLYTWAERYTVRVKCLAQEHNTIPWPVLEPKPLDPESSVLATRPSGFYTRKKPDKIEPKIMWQLTNILSCYSASQIKGSLIINCFYSFFLSDFSLHRQNTLKWRLIL